MSNNTPTKYHPHSSEISTVSSGSNGSTVVNGDSYGMGHHQLASASTSHQVPTTSLEQLHLNSPQPQSQSQSQSQQQQQQVQPETQSPSQSQSQSSLHQNSDQNSDQNSGLSTKTMQSVEMVPAEANLSERQQLEQQHRQQQEQLQQQPRQQQQQPQQVPQVQQQSSIQVPQQQQPAQAQVQAQAQQQQQAAAATRRKFNLDDFRIHRTLGTGSFGRVHLVQSRYNSRFYAMKVLKKSEVVRLRQVEHTNNEKMILERVEHPFLINLWGTFQDVRNLYMVMDYVVGGELFSVLRKSQ
ncbi:camp-dependent protein kinase catalytic subunit, partial [Mortierella sp. AD094]